MQDWDKLNTVQYTGGQQPYSSIPTAGGGWYNKPTPKPSCFESKCTNCPFGNECKNKK